jgi:hypothetical protein
MAPVPAVKLGSGASSDVLRGGEGVAVGGVAAQAPGLSLLAAWSGCLLPGRTGGGGGVAGASMPPGGPAARRRGLPRLGP